MKALNIKSVLCTFGSAALISLPMAVNASNIQVSNGKVHTFASGSERGYDIRGKATMVRLPSGITIADLRVKGLSPNTTYGSHVHNQACDNGNGGGHYQHETGQGPDFVNDSNEIWLSFTSNAKGKGKSFAKHEHIAREEAQSVVIHDTDGARIACADLSNLPQLTNGKFETFTAGIERGYDIRGKAKMVRMPNGKTTANLLVKGLLPNTAYGSHVHNQACNNGNGGGHYQHEIGQGPDYVNDSNEIWLSFTSNARGKGKSFAKHEHIAREEAQSVVIHDTDGTRIACADLN